MLLPFPPALLQQAAPEADFLAQADALAKQKRWSDMEALGRSHIGNQPGDARGHLVLALALLGAQRSSEALSPVRRAAELAPTDPVAWYWRGVLEAQQGHRAEFLRVNTHLGTLRREAQVALWSVPGIFAFAAEPGSPPTVDPKTIKLSAPPGPTPFPDTALATRLKGRVVLELIIDAQGIPTRVQALAGHPVLAAAAERHAAAWRFVAPAHPVRLMALVPFGIPAEGDDIPLDLARDRGSIFELKRLWGHEDAVK